MGKTVVMIAREMEKIFRPNSERHFLIGVMRADRVQNCECRQQDPGSVEKLQTSVGQREPTDKNNQQNILQHPRLPIQWVNRCDDPDRRANRRVCSIGSTNPRGSDNARRLRRFSNNFH